MCINREKIDLKDQMSKLCNTSAKSTSAQSTSTSRLTKVPHSIVRRGSQSVGKFQEEKYPELSMKSFFEFMRTAYGVNNSFEELVNTVTVHSEIDWNALVKTELNPQKLESKEDIDSSKVALQNEDDNIVTCPESQSDNVAQNEEPVLSKIMKKQLSDVLHEGLLDSVLPYLIPKPTLSESMLKQAASNEPRKSISLGDGRESSKLVKEKAKEKENCSTRKKSFENEIEIHVCDEAKNVRKDFRCPQRLLIQNMSYFADITTGQKLEEMDISVHCDIVIFDWLMRWVKRDIIKKSEWPTLEASNVIPIMVSASFLQMEPLLNSCLLFCHDHMSDILKTSSVLSCLNDNLLTSLADLFTNLEVENLKDKKDKIQSKLFCKLIVLLGNPVPDNSKGHYSSLATLFKCSKCDKTILKSLSDLVPCIPSAMRIDPRGNLHNKHTRHLSWNLDDYIIGLRSKLRSWRKVYWRLWGDCHFLLCGQCDVYFPVNQMDWCTYHPESPQFFTNEQLTESHYPIGRYPCCSQITYKFQILPHRNGCQFKEHLPKIVTGQEEDILYIFSNNRDLIAIEPPQLFFPDKIIRLVARDPSLESGKLLCKETHWWEGIELAPSRPKLGLLGKIWGSGLGRSFQSPTKTQRKLRRQDTRTNDGSSPISSVSDSDEAGLATDCDSSDEDDSCYSEESHRLLNFVHPKRRSRHSAIKRNEFNGAWSADLTLRCNQDNQREFEEKVTNQMISLLTKRMNVEIGFAHKAKSSCKLNHAQSLGGTYVKLEAEFREQLAQNNKNKNSSQSAIRSTRSAK